MFRRTFCLAKKLKTSLHFIVEICLTVEKNYKKWYNELDVLLFDVSEYDQVA